MRGDRNEAALWARAMNLVRAHNIESEDDAGPLFEHPPEDADTEVRRRLRQMYEAGGWVLVESAIADIPSDLRWLFESGAVTLDQLALLNQSLGVATASDLAAAAHESTIRSIAGLTPDVEATIALAMPTLRKTLPRIPLGRAVAIAQPFLDRLRAARGIQWARPAGSLRRGQDSVGDIEIVAATDDPGAILDELTRVPEVTRCLHRSARRAYVL